MNRNPTSLGMRRGTEGVRRPAAVSLFILLFLSISSAQERVIDHKWGIPDSPFTCAMNSVYLGSLVHSMREDTQDNKVLIVIARLGKGERLRSHNHRRLHNAVQYLMDFGTVGREEVVTGEGKPVANDYGRLEFYLNGELVGALLVPRGRDLCVDCCENRDPRYYPDKARVKAK